MTQYVPAINPVRLLFVEPFPHKKVKLPVPPEPEPDAVPSLNELQLGSVLERVTVTAEGSVMVTQSVAVQPCASLTVRQ